MTSRSDLSKDTLSIGRHLPNTITFFFPTSGLELEA